MSALSLLLAILAAGFSYPRRGSLDGTVCSRAVILQGANIDRACLLVALSALVALVGLVALALARQTRRTLAVLLFLEAIAMTIAIALVLADSATYLVSVPHRGCPGGDWPPHLDVHHRYWLLAVCGMSSAFLLLRAFGAWRGVEQPDPPESRSPLLR